MSTSWPALEADAVASREEDIEARPELLQLVMTVEVMGSTWVTEPNSLDPPGQVTEASVDGVWRQVAARHYGPALPQPGDGRKLFRLWEQDWFNRYPEVLCHVAPTPARPLVEGAYRTAGDELILDIRMDLYARTFFTGRYGPRNTAGRLALGRVVTTTEAAGNVAIDDAPGGSALRRGFNTRDSSSPSVQQEVVDLWQIQGPTRWVIEDTFEGRYGLDGRYAGQVQVACTVDFRGL